MAVAAHRGQVFIAPHGTSPDQGGWTFIGETEGFEFKPESVGPDWVPFPYPAEISFSVTVDYSDRGAEFRRIVRQLEHDIRQGKRSAHQRQHPGSYSRCRACHPEQDRRPLAVDGHEYRRRQRERRRNR